MMLDLKLLLQAIGHIREKELEDDKGEEANEYLDCFVALGGSPNKDGAVSKEDLIFIIK